MATAQPPSVLALPGAWPLEVGSGTALASCAAVAQWRFCSVHASANQLVPMAIAIGGSFSRTTGRPTPLGEPTSDVQPPRPSEGTLMSNWNTALSPGLARTHLFVL